ncbi:MAG TPA: NAD(P)/FAD-dependent oxidoreductase [Kofleriaceae bacterium]
MADYDDLIIGTGMAGLSVGALLAKSGRRVLMLEAHDTPGGYAHTFKLRDYRFCAQVHYIFNCGEGETVHELLEELGLAREVPFVRLDPEGFDHIVVAGERHRIPNGLAKFRDRLVRRYPEAVTPLREYFRIVTAIGEELAQLGDLPDRLSPSVLVKGAMRFRHLLRYMRSTLEDVYDSIRMPQRLRAVLAGQSGDYLLPPRDVSMLLHVALVTNYDRGAYYPRRHYFQFVESLAGYIRRQPGCAILLEHEVERIEVASGRVSSVVTKNGQRFTAQRYISNADPKLTARLAGEHNLDRSDARRLRYEYSCGSFTMYLAVRGIDLREHGFGSHNVWHYPHDDINRMYDDQLVRDDLTNPWLFMSTPSLHSDEPGLCPPGEQIIEIATACDHARLDRMRATNRREYNARKKQIRDTILDILEANYIPNLRAHLTMQVAGTPTTNTRYCWAPAGNAYGAALTPKHVGILRKPWRSSLGNLWLVNATAGMPSVAGAIGAGMRLYRSL